MSAAVNDRPHEGIVPLPHLPLTGELHPLRQEFVRWLATGNVITVTLAVVICTTIYFWPRPATIPTDNGRFVNRGIVFSPPPIPTGQNDVGYTMPASSVDRGTYEATPEDELFKDPDLSNNPGGDRGEVPGGEEGPYTGAWNGSDSLLIPEPATPREPFDGGWTEAPVLISCVPPVYPQMVQDAGIDGTVQVRVFIGLNGHVKNAYVVEGSSALREAALTSARSAVFKPAKQGTHPVEVWVVIPITFQLHERY